MKKQIIGREEWCSLPELGIPAIKARVDSGAKTSALHAYNIQFYDDYVEFDIHPIQGNRLLSKRCRARLVDKRIVKSSSGVSEKRIVIETELKLGDDVRTIEITLTSRDTMGYRMLLGRQAIPPSTLIDPNSRFCLGEISDREAQKLYKAPKKPKTTLRIALLASNPTLYSNKRIIEAGLERGHEMQFINVDTCYMNINARSPVIHHLEGEIKELDAVIPRFRPSATFFGCSVLRQLEAAGTFSLNRPHGITLASDKLHSLQMLAAKGIEMPTTGFASSPNNTSNLVKLVGGTPLVIKLLEGTQGVGVVLAETGKAAESVINAFKSLKAQILVQEFVKEARGHDLRCFVIDGKVVGAIERIAADGEFRANLHLGGTAHPTKLTREEKKLAVNAAKIIGLHIAGVDIIRSDHGPKILEVNSSPGLQGIESATSLDVAGMMIESIEKHVIGEKK